MLAELLVLTDFGACLLVELVCYPFSWIGRGRKKASSSGLDNVPALEYLLSILAIISRAADAFEDFNHGRHAEEAGLALIFTCIYKSDINLEKISFYN